MGRGAFISFVIYRGKHGIQQEQGIGTGYRGEREKVSIADRGGYIGWGIAREKDKGRKKEGKE